MYVVDDVEFKLELMLSVFELVGSRTSTIRARAFVLAVAKQNPFCSDHANIITLEYYANAHAEHHDAINAPGIVSPDPILRTLRLL